MEGLARCLLVWRWMPLVEVRIAPRGRGNRPLKVGGRERGVGRGMEMQRVVRMKVMMNLAGVLCHRGEISL